MSKAHSVNSSNRISIILSLAFILKLLFVLIVYFYGDINFVYAPDTDSYLRPAHSLFEQGRFYIEGNPQINRTPGYSVFLIPGILLGNVVLITLILQALAGVLSVYWVYRLAELLFNSKRLSNLAALIYLFEPSATIYCAKLLSETIFSTLFLWSLVILLEAIILKKGIKYFMLSAIILALSAYVRPIVLYLPMAMFVIFLVARVLGIITKAAELKKACAFTLLFYVLIGFWIFRNYQVAGYFGFASQHDRDLYIYHALAIKNRLNEIEGRPALYRQGDEAVFFAEYPEYLSVSRAEQMVAMGKAGKKIILENPKIFLEIYLKGLLAILIEPGTSDLLLMFHRPSERTTLPQFVREYGPMLGLYNFAVMRTDIFVLYSVFTGYNLMLMLFSLLVLFSLEPGKRVLVLLLGLSAFYFALVSGGPYGHARLRHPMLPLLCLLSAAGLNRLRPVSYRIGTLN